MHQIQEAEGRHAGMGEVVKSSSRSSLVRVCGAMT